MLQSNLSLGCVTLSAANDGGDMLMTIMLLACIRTDMVFCCAAALNMAVFLLIGKTSALTMNIAGVVKDWMLIGLSVVMYGSQVSPLNLGGYLIAFLAVCVYNYRKLQSMKKSSPPALKDELQAASNPELRPLNPTK